MVAAQTGKLAEDSAIAESGAHDPSLDGLPTRKMFSPNVVSAVSKKVTETLHPVPVAPVCMAIALRAGTVASKELPETLKADQVQIPEELTPLIISQYDPSAREVEKVVLHAESSLLMATNPADPRPKAIRLDCGETQLVIPAVPTLLRKPVMPEMAIHRC